MFATLYMLATSLILCGAILGCFYLIAATYGVFRFTSHSVVTTPQSTPITILKPLCGDEHDLAINLRSFCMQNYAVYQIVFGIQNADDAALPIVNALIEEFPAIDITVVVDSTQLSQNMKVANLQNMLSAAKYDYLVLADSDMRVRPDYLTQVTAPAGRSFCRRGHVPLSWHFKWRFLVRYGLYAYQLRFFTTSHPWRYA